MRFFIKRSAVLIIFVMNVITASGVCAGEAPFVYDDHGRRDPFWKLVNQSGMIINYEKDLLISDMVLEGIMLESGGNNIAIINGKIIKPADKIGVFVVDKINATSVVLKKGQTEYTLKLKKGRE